MKAEHVMKSGAVVSSREDARSSAGGFPRLWHFALEYLMALPVGVTVGLAWANLAPEHYFGTMSRLAFAVNEIAMVFFFGWITKEIVEATLTGGVLHSWRRATMPIIASAGLVVAAALAYGPAVRMFDQRMLLQAWPVTAATDLAAGYLVTRLIFGRSAAVPFFLLLAISANGIGFALLALAGPGRELHPAAAVIIFMLALSAMLGFRKARVKSFWPYVLVGGSLSWVALYLGGVHPALALLPVVPFLPHGRRDPGFFVDASPEAHDALSRFERWARYPAQFALLLFGIVNGGVQLHALEAGALALPLTALVAKPVGMLAAVGLALLAGLHLPRQLGWRELVVLGFAASIGFTLALFFATAMLGAGQVLNETRIGALVTLAGGAVAVGAAKLLHVGRFAR
jgi:NhaA family Na+:H+ antiporter